MFKPQVRIYSNPAIKNYLGNGWNIPAIEKLSWGWFMALGLPHDIFCSHSIILYISHSLCFFRFSQFHGPPKHEFNRVIVVHPKSEKMTLGSLGGCSPNLGASEKRELIPFFCHWRNNWCARFLSKSSPNEWFSHLWSMNVNDKLIIP